MQDLLSNISYSQSFVMSPHLKVHLLTHLNIHFQSNYRNLQLLFCNFHLRLLHYKLLPQVPLFLLLQALSFPQFFLDFLKYLLCLKSWKLKLAYMQHTYNLYPLQCNSYCHFHLVPQIGMEHELHQVLQFDFLFLHRLVIIC